MITRMIIGGHRFDLETAVMPEDVEKGLSGRTEIARDGGMFFPCHLEYLGPEFFWMKDCLCDLDIVFVGNHRIIGWAMMPAEPRRAGETDENYEGRLRRYEIPHGTYCAVELAAGTIERLGLSIGDAAYFDAVQPSHPFP